MYSSVCFFDVNFVAKYDFVWVVVSNVVDDVQKAVEAVAGRRG
jgi:hypothetical protein